jgi:phospholipid/cholesterol/gamma-HCH transport system permease protein
MLRALQSGVLTLQEIVLLSGRVVRAGLGGRGGSARLLAQMDAIGIGSVPIVLLTGLFTGMVLALQAAVQLAPFGATVYVGRFVAASMIRELGPVLSGIMVAGRVGAGIAAELGAMQATEQVDALESMGFDAVHMLVVPRVIACCLMLPLLALLADVAGMAGATLVASTNLGVMPSSFWAAALEQLRDDGVLGGVLPADLVQGLVKPLVFGAIIAIVACDAGLRSERAAAGVGAATTRAVVRACISILIADYFLTQFLLLLTP